MPKTKLEYKILKDSILAGYMSLFSLWEFSKVFTYMYFSVCILYFTKKILKYHFQ